MHVRAHRLLPSRLWPAAVMSALLAQGLALAHIPAAGAIEGPVTPSQRALSIVYASVSYESQWPLPAAEARARGTRASVEVKIPGVTPGKSVDVRFIQPSADYDFSMPQTVRSDGTVQAGSYFVYRSLAEAKRNISKVTGPATIEVRVAPDAAPMTIKVSRWTVQPPVALNDVKMSVKGKTVTFTGRLVTDAGKPIANGFVSVLQFLENDLEDLGSLVQANSKGFFTARVTNAKRGYIGVAGLTPTGSTTLGFGVFSRPFTYRP